MIIGLDQVQKRYRHHLAVDSLSLEVKQGQVVALLGPSGCGKTTTLRLIAGLERPDAGRIVLAGRPVAGPGTWVPPEVRHVGLVFQDYALFPHLTVHENVAFGLQGAASDATGRVTALLDLVGLHGLGRRFPHELSGGQQQRVALARALAPRPAVVLLDEPFSNLDAALRRAMRAEVRAILRAAQATAVFVTHDQEEALSLADQVAVMQAGRLAQFGPPHEIYLRPASRAVAEFIGEVNFLPGEGRDKQVHCALGTLLLSTPARGRVDVAIRPEQIAAVPDPNGNALIETITFYGHDQLTRVVIEQPDGATLRLDLRSFPRLDLQPGVRLALTVHGPVVAFDA